MHAAPYARRDAPRLPWAFPLWLLPFWVTAVGWQWWTLSQRLFRGAAAHPAAAASAGLVAVAGRFAGFAVEAAFYTFLWASVGERLPFWRFASWLVSISMIDVLAESMRHDLSARGAPAPVATMLWGLGLLPGAGGGWRVAFGTLGVATLVRIAWTATMQARALGTSLARPLLATVLTWTVTRLVLWAVADLARGRNGPS